MAALQQVVLSNPSWQGKVAAVTVNQAGAQAGIAACEVSSTLPILQDDDASSMWMTLGGSYSAIVVFDQAGIRVTELKSGSFPQAEEELEGVVNGLLQ